MCWESFPCQHNYNGNLMGAMDIYKLLQNAIFINKDDTISSKHNLTDEQKNSLNIFHIKLFDKE
jgi:hypothetical protein